MSLNQEIHINNSVIGEGHPPYIIAEMACAHNGNFEKAKKLIHQAVDAKADAIQLQFFKTRESVTPHHEVFKIVQSIEFSDKQWEELVAYARALKIHVFACTFDLPSAQLAVKLKVDGIKLNSADLSNPEVVTEVASSGIPFTLGTGASTLDEIANGLHLAKKAGATNIILMHGVQNFPTKTEDLNISRLHLLKKVFNIPVGYHDHTDGDDSFALNVDLIAIGLGANIIEKHICLDRAENGLDYQAALEPDEFKSFVQTIRKAYIAYGSEEIRPFTESDIKYRKFQKKSIVAARKISSGEVINRKDVFFIRNVEPGLTPFNFPMVEGKIASRDINQYDNIQLTDLL